MSEQPSLPGFERPRNAQIRSDAGRLSDVRHGIFFAAFLERDAAARAHGLAQRLCRERRLLGAPIAAERLHVSLAGFGEYPRRPHRLVRDLSEAASTVDIETFDVSFDRVMTFGQGFGQRATVLRCGGGLADLMQLRESLDAAIAGLGLAGSKKSAFVPHVTLLYDRTTVPEHSIEPIRWNVREFVLVDSLRRRTLHVPLGRWRLRDGFPCPPA